MKHSIKWGLFVGVTIASLSALALQFIPLNYWTLVAFLYLYSIVGALTSYIVYKDLEKRDKLKEESAIENILNPK